MTLWLALLLSAAQANVVDRIAAVVNNEVITLSEVYDLGGPFIDERCRGQVNKGRCEREAELEVLDSLILQTLIRQQLQKLSLDLTTDEIDRTIDQIGRENGIEDRETFKTAIEGQGVSWVEYREQLSEQIRQMKFNESVLRPRVSVTDDEVRDRYNRTVREFEAPEKYDLEAIGLRIEATAANEPGEGDEPETPDDPKTPDDPETPDEPEAPVDRQQLLIQTVARATGLAAQIKAGELTWEDAVAQHDVLGRGGRLGTLALDDMSPAVADAVRTVKVGEVTAPVVMGEMVFLIKPVQKSEPEVLAFDEVEDRLRVALFEEKIEEELEQWYQQERRRAALKILLESE